MSSDFLFNPSGLASALPAELSMLIDILMCGLRLGIAIFSNTCLMCCVSNVVCPIAYSFASAELKAIVD
eukprot:5925405-Amphidinium_carterae.2